MILNAALIHYAMLMLDVDFEEKIKVAEKIQLGSETPLHSILSVWQSTFTNHPWR